MIRRLLIANRGEIAVRIIRACRELDVESVAIYSDVDRNSPHVQLADIALPISTPAPSHSYLAVDKIIGAARTSGADAIHPGYGFLAENPSLAAACADAGLVFVGPPASVIERMGSKIAARTMMEAAGVPVVPGGVPADQSDEGIRAALETVGLPALIKASAGGGGKGMRVIRDIAEADPAIASARREAGSAFGDATLYVERFLEHPRHVEVQVFADHHGHVVHVFERECSIQRRHQKLIEETPSTALTNSLRDAMGAAAVEAARAAGYRNAGTVEFLLEGAGREAHFYFLEMNTRLQVEHAITEAVVGIDLVAAQLEVASGGQLPWSQEELKQRGHAIECRILAEDPARDFLPQAGPLVRYIEPRGPGVRVDSGVVEGLEVPVEYDSLLAKLVVHAEDRASALRRAVAALSDFTILGIRTNVGFLKRVVAHARFQAGDYDTGFIGDEALKLLVVNEETLLSGIAAVVGARREQRPARVASSGGEKSTADDPWKSLGRWGRDW